MLAIALGLTAAGATVLAEQGSDTATRGASAVASDSAGLDGLDGPAPTTGSPGGSASGFGYSADGPSPGLGSTTGIDPGTGTAAPTASTSGTATTAVPATSGATTAAAVPGATTAALPPVAATVPVTPSSVNSHPTSVNISTNIAASPSSDPSCSSAPTGAACINAGIAALNHARALLNLPSYAIPANFTTMTVAQQLLTLSNLDRTLYGLPAINGVNATVSAAAQAGVTSGGDPAGVAVGANAWHAWASNWASGYPNAVYTYYGWMYDDGVGSPNADCTSAGASGCWGHRLNTLYNFGTGVQIAMGVGNTGKVFTELYESFAATASIPYS